MHGRYSEAARPLPTIQTERPLILVTDMKTEMITMLVRLPRWAEPQIVAVANADRLDTWRESDLLARKGPTEVSLDVAASTHADARAVVRGVLGPLPPQAFLAST